MKLFDKNICYTHLLWAMQQPQFTQSISKVSFTKPDIASEGMAGYISTDIEIEINNLKLFAEIWYKWYTVDIEEKLKIRSTALKGTCDASQ